MASSLVAGGSSVAISSLAAPAITTGLSGLGVGAATAAIPVVNVIALAAMPLVSHIVASCQIDDIECEKYRLERKVSELDENITKIKNARNQIDQNYKALNIALDAFSSEYNKALSVVYPEGDKKMSKDLTQNFMDVVPDLDGKSSLPMLDVSENVLSLAKTITSSAENLYRLNTGIEDTRLKTQLLADYNENTFALHNKRIDKNCEHTDKVIAYAGKIIDYGIENDKDMMMLQGLNAMVQIVTHEALPELPDFEKQLDSGEKLQLG